MDSRLRAPSPSHPGQPALLRPAAPLTVSRRTLQPSAFVQKALLRLKKRPEGFKTSAACHGFVGPGYLDAIRRSRFTVCGSAARRPKTSHDVNILCAKSSSCKSSVDCYTAPFVRAGNLSSSNSSSSGDKTSVSLCRSTNLVLNSCKFLEGEQAGSLSRRLPLPERGAVKLACPLVKLDQVAKRGSKLEWLRNTQHDVWWAKATQDVHSVARACAPNSSSLVTTPTLFLLRDRHANHAAELESLSAVFSFLAALEPQDVAAHGLQVVIADRAPASPFLETWARISRPHRLRILAHDPFPPNTCFRSAFHIHTSAGGGLAHNANPATTSCESPVLTGLSHWLRQLYGEGDPSARAPMAAAPSAAAVAGPAAEAAGVRGLRPPAGGIVVKNVLWLSRRNLEMLRLLLNASSDWQSVRLVRNEDAVVAALVAAVQEWNAESCLLRRFDRTVKAEYERSLAAVNAVHTSAATSAHPQSNGSAAGAQGAAAAAAATPAAAAATPAVAAVAAVAAGAAAPGGRRSLLEPSQQQRDNGLDEQLDEGEEEEGEEEDEEEDEDEELLQAAAAAAGFDEALFGQRRQTLVEAADEEDGADVGAAAAGGGGSGGGSGGGGSSHSYMIGNNVVALDRLWEADPSTRDGCRRTNVLFKFVEGSFGFGGGDGDGEEGVSYHMQLQTVFRSGVLVGVHGAGLAHGFFMPPGQSAVLQLVGKAIAKVPAINVFRNMAAGLGNHYEDVPYGDLDVDVERLKRAVKRSMDFVAQRVMDAQMRRSGALRLVLVDQSHFAIVVPSEQHCPANASAQLWQH
ncbi:hypothetical protein PLESTF_001671000 [Pleodorina starrii]|nr:hypothetical protein PLESTF_001671000 [Pleodorina starrii]